MIYPNKCPNYLIFHFVHQFSPTQYARTASVLLYFML